MKKHYKLFKVINKFNECIFFLFFNFIISQQYTILWVVVKILLLQTKNFFTILLLIDNFYTEENI